MTKEALLQRLTDCVVNMEDDQIPKAVQDYLQAGYGPEEGIMSGLVEGMKKAGELFDQNNYFIPEILFCSDAMYAGISEFRSAMTGANGEESKGTIILAVVEGDNHDIGKSLVKVMLEVNGYIVEDVGFDVPGEKIVQAAVELNADMIALSALMTTTMQKMEEVIRLLKEKGLQDKIKVIVGGAPVSQKFADKIGADGYSRTAMGAASLANDLLMPS
ncbi:cobalamin B12-binding domain-containing protein [Dehalobacterium formicoaceticum]|uniref:Corrinoid protein n=1 Tax=Dehalobacterium formicoaceticum TaxID=51515 RepID=A0ABT1Y8W9_9FIRM|nr:corrinoid protein [Dehalobacterium formicoaceticum]MCR6546931.1 corrinoid protein [Dehalobacterium formicoaceticum]